MIGATGLRLLGSAVSAALVGACFTAPLEPSAFDRAVVVTVDDFAPYFSRPQGERPERLDKARHLTGTYEVDYAFEASGLTIRSEVRVHPSAARARLGFDATRHGLRAWFLAAGASTEEVNATAVEWGRGTFSFRLFRGERQIGNGYVSYQGRVQTYALITGHYFSDHRQFEAVVAQRLRLLRGYDPGRMRHR